MYRVPSNRKLPGLTFFVTAVTRQRKPLFATQPAVGIVLDILQFFRQRSEWELYGYVIMPDHIHFVAKPIAPQTIPALVRRLKTFTAKQLGQGPIWEEGYHSEGLTSYPMIRQKLNYIFENPVRAGLAADRILYPWSSACESLSDVARRTIDPFVAESAEAKTAGGRH
jgi:putative transposase